jgi:S-adenosylmethionine-dependent methyltransferase
VPALRVLDAGCGTGDYALALARMGYSVMLLDSSPAMLELARARSTQADPAVQQRLTFQCCTVSDLTRGRGAGPFDLILAHTLLEYLEDPWSCLRELVTLLAPRGLLSLLVTSQAADPLRWALARHDLDKARLALAETSSYAVFELPRHTIPAEEILARLEALGIACVSNRGIRIFSDYLPAERLSEPQFWQALLDLELDASAIPAYRAIARYYHIIGVGIESQ